jgi:hypothetical protein
VATSWFTIVPSALLGLLIGIAVGWAGKHQPAWASGGVVVAILVALFCADAELTYLQQQPSNSTPPVAGAAFSASNLVPVSQIDPDQAHRAYLSITPVDAGPARLARSSLDGGSRKILWPVPASGAFAVVGSGRQLVMGGADDGESGASGLAVETASGRVVRRLTSPPAHTSDTNPAVTSGGTVYFLRERDRAGTGVPGSVQVMRVRLHGRSATPVPLPLPVAWDSLSVDGAGDLLAAICQPRGAGGPTQACVVNMRTGRVRFQTSFPSAVSVTDAAISPNGHYLAYTDDQSNVYGTMQVYVHDLAHNSTIMVSRLPGISREASWLPGSPSPCLLFSDHTAASDRVFLSCLAPHSGTALAGYGDNPVWLGTPALQPARPFLHLDWGLLWRRARPVILLILVFIVSNLMGLFGGWVPRPKVLSNTQIAAMIVALGLADVAGTVFLPDLIKQPPSGLTTVAKLDPAQAHDVILATDSTLGTGELLATHLDGTNPQPLGWYPGASPYIPLGGSASKFISAQADLSDPGTGIELLGSTGQRIRNLTFPAGAETDAYPALAAGQQRLYFIRGVVQPGNGVSTVTHIQVMWTPLTGHVARPVRLGTKVIEGHISVDDKGDLLAAECADPFMTGGPTQVCVFSLPSGRLRYVTSPRHGTADDPAISPTGRYLAFSGTGVLYIHDIVTGKTTHVAALPGTNDQPVWVRGSANPCVLFTDEQPPTGTIYLACLTPLPAWAPVTSGTNPAWLGPP